MGSEWPKVSVAEVCNVYLGGTPKRSDPSYWGGSIKWATAKDIAGCATRYLVSTEEAITKKGIKESAAKILDKDTIVITARGTVGALCMLGEPMSFNQTCYGLVGKKNKITQHYLYYALKSAISQMHSLSYGTVFNTITMKTFEDIEISLPPLPEQRAIAHILGTLDDKIELNRKMNQTLEAMAQAIFESWFVDFDPVIDNALKAGKPIPDSLAKRAAKRKQVLDKVRQNDYPPLPKEIADLFPDEFEDSEIGPIPRGWKVSTIGAEFELTMGQSPPGRTYNEDGKGLPFFQGRKDFGFRYPSKRVFCTEPKRIAEQGDTLVSVRAPVGDVNMASEQCCIGRGLARIRHKSKSRSYTYYAMHMLRDHFARFETEGTVFGAINKSQFQNIRWLAPPKTIVKQFEEIVGLFDEAIETNELELASLAAIRDSLLPKLLNGDIELSQA